MKNKSFMRLWAPLIAALFFGVAFLGTHLALNAREKAKAEGELNALLDMAETRAAADEMRLETLRAAADQSAIHKARTIERFLAHDDTLLQTDALAALAELLDLNGISVVDGLGSVIAASDGAKIGADYAADTDMSWVMALLEDGAAPGTGGEGSERIAGTQRSDIDGLVLVWNEDALLADALNQADLRTAVTNLAVAPDQLKLVETTGESGTFEQDGMLYVQRSLDEVAIIAWRPLSEVYAVQNAVLIAIAAFGVLTILTLFIWQAFFSGGRETAEDRTHRHRVEADLEALEAEAWAQAEPRRRRKLAPEPEPEEAAQERPEEDIWAQAEPRRRRKPAPEPESEEAAQERPEEEIWAQTEPRRRRKPAPEPEPEEAAQERPEEDIWAQAEPRRHRRPVAEAEEASFEKKRRRLIEIIDHMDEEPEETVEPRPERRTNRKVKKVSPRGASASREPEDDPAGFDKIFE
jgi:hypothetical protein